MKKVVMSIIIAIFVVALVRSQESYTYYSVENGMTLLHKPEITIEVSKEGMKVYGHNSNNGIRNMFPSKEIKYNSQYNEPKRTPTHNKYPKPTSTQSPFNYEFRRVGDNIYFR